MRARRKFEHSLAAMALWWLCGCAGGGDQAAIATGVDGAVLAADGGSLGKAAPVHAVKIVSFQKGDAAGWGEDKLPDIVLGAPDGGGPHKGSLHVLSLGKGGSILLELGKALIDGPGPDLLVFENPFTGWRETGVVAVSDDGASWTSWPCDCANEKADFPGCAGVSPVLASRDNGVDPTDPKAAGGDAFDLADIGVKRARFVRVTDTGKNEYEGKTGGFDLDAITAIHHE